jgi:hypothetical protein
MIEDFDFSEEQEDYGPVWQPDAYFIEAQKEIRNLYEADKESVFYVRQLQVKFEKKYYHWITHNALMGLLKTGYFI